MALESDLIYDWNAVTGPEFERLRRPMLDDETLRDGLQSPSVLDPSIEKKIQILHLMEGLGIDSVDLGLPGAGPRAKADVLRLAQEIAASKLRIRPNCAARTVVSEAVGVPIPPNYPVVGADAFRTATGVHAAAVIKAFRKNDVELANQVYSGVPSHWFGMEQKIEIGPMSGKSNVIYWLEKQGIEPTKELVERIFARAKQADRLLTDAEVLDICRETAA